MSTRFVWSGGVLIRKEGLFASACFPTRDEGGGSNDYRWVLLLDELRDGAEVELIPPPDRIPWKHDKL